MNSDSAQIRTLQIGTGWFPENPGGLDRFYYNLIRRLPATGVGARGLVVGTHDVVRQSGGHVRAFAAFSDSLPHRMMAARRAVAEELRLHPPDLVSSHFALFAAPALDLLAKQPLVVQFQGPWAQEAAAESGGGALRSRIKCAAILALERLVYNRASRFIVLSDAFAQILTRSYGISPELIRKVPGGVDLERFSIGATRSEARAQLGLPNDRPIIVSVRRLARRMGLENLIDAVAEIRNAFPDLLLVIAGGGALREALQGRIDARGLSQNIRLMGFVPEDSLPVLYRAADISIVPTLALEGFGLTTVESLAAGTPVLVTPVGALPEVMTDLSPELVLRSSSASDIAEGLRGVLAGTIKLPGSDACRAYTKQRYTWEQVASATRDVYREVLAEA